MAGKFRAMTLIEEGEIQRLRQKQIKDYNPTLSALARFDEMIHNVFSNQKMGEDEKSKVLNHGNEKFQNLYSKYKRDNLFISKPTIEINPATSLATERKITSPQNVADEPR